MLGPVAQVKGLLETQSVAFIDVLIDFMRPRNKNSM